MTHRQSYNFLTLAVFLTWCLAIVHEWKFLVTFSGFSGRALESPGLARSHRLTFDRPRFNRFKDLEQLKVEAAYADRASKADNALNISLGMVADIGGLRIAKQSDRFPSNPDEDFVIFDTPNRASLRQQLSDALNFATEQFIQVNGINGQGKSHVLLRFAHEQRTDGHLVVYIPTAEQLVLSGLKAFCFAWRKALSQFDDSLYPENHFALNTQLPEGATPEPIVVSINQLWSAWRFDRGTNWVKRVKQLVEELNDLAAARGKRHCLIIDQDNRLWRSKATDPSPGDATDLSLRIIKSISPHFFVLCASANNEGWAKREWPQLVLNPEQVPDDMIHVALPKLQIDDPDVQKSLMEITGGIPLELKLFSDYAQQLHVQQVTAEWVKKFKTSRKNEVEVQLETLLATKSVSEQESIMKSIGYFLAAQIGEPQDEKSTSINVDKRFMYFDELRSPHFLSPIVADAFADVYTAFLENQPKARGWDSHGHWYEVQVERLLKAQHDILRLTGNNQRGAKQVRFEGPRDFQAVKSAIDSLSSSEILYVAPPFCSYRFFDGVLVVRERSSFPGTTDQVFVIYFNCCAGDKHKDSQSDMEKNERPWQDQVAQWRNSSRSVAYHEGFLWVTPCTGTGLTLGGQVQQFIALPRRSLWKNVFNPRIASQAASKVGRLDTLRLQITNDDLITV